MSTIRQTANSNINNDFLSGLSVNTNSNGGGSLDLTDYAMIKNGSYGKLVKAYYGQEKAQKSTETKESSSKLTLMAGNAGSMANSANALMDDSLWQKKTVTEKDEKTGEEVKLYDPANCFFVHYLKSKCRFMNYGYVDVTNRAIVFDGTTGDSRDYYSTKKRTDNFSLSEYLKLLFEAQKAQRVPTREEADAVLVVAKPSAENELSLIDNNFFME